MSNDTGLVIIELVCMEESGEMMNRWPIRNVWRVSVSCVRKANDPKYAVLAFGLYFVEI